MPDLKPCPKCNTAPVQETRPKMLGKIQDGGYTVTQGRYKCPKCGFAPGWGMCYCVDYGWDRNAEVWNNFVERGASDGIAQD